MMITKIRLKGKEGKNSLGISDMTGNVAEFCKDCMSNTFYKESIGRFCFMKTCQWFYVGCIAISALLCYNFIK